MDGRYFGAAVLGYFGVTLTYVGWKRVRNGRDSQSWTSVEGTIISSDIDRKVYRIDTEARSEFAYFPAVHYRYRVGGVSYQSDRVSAEADIGRGRSGLATQIAARYPAGKRCRVYYDPADPSDAVLERGSGGVSMLYLVCGVICLLGGAAIFRSISV